MTKLEDHKFYPWISGTTKE